jgi:heptosyltransferase-2
MSYSRILVRGANWVGDAVMSIPALRAIRERHPRARIDILALPGVADLYARESFCDQILPCRAARGARNLSAKLAIARQLRKQAYDCAVLLPNSFDSALLIWLARIPERIGYARDGRGLLLTRAIPPPRPGQIPRHESHYYLELLRRAGWIERLPDDIVIRLDGREPARRAGRERFEALGLALPVIGVSPGAAYGGAKRWLPERFAEAARALAGELQASVVLFGSPEERLLCEGVRRMLASQVRDVRNLAGETTLRQFIEMAAACTAFLTNDSGAMHIASALGIPTVAIFGATDHIATGPTGPLARVVRRPVDCSPCLLRECPIDHRCMTGVSADQVVRATLELVK